MSITAEDYLEERTIWYEALEEDLIEPKHAMIALEMAKSEIKEKAIEAFNEAMIYFESPDCPTAEEALKHFIACLDQGLDSGCSEKPNNWICGNCDAYCECSITGAKHDNPACPAFDNSVLSQLNSKDHETKTS